MNRPRSVHFLINPASGQERPILAPLNSCLSESSVTWDVGVLQPNGERRAIERALEANPELLAIWGGDGTVAKLATVFVELGVEIPVLPLHGGTANALATQLQVPNQLEDVIVRLLDGQATTFWTDVGVARGHAFLLRVSIGSAAGVTEYASRNQKLMLGPFAYALSAVQAMREAKPVEYALCVDGQRSTHSAIACIVANSSGTGIRSPLASDLRPDDSRLEVLLVPDLSWAARALANLTSGAGLMDGAPRLAGSSIAVSCSEPATVHADGEDIGQTPVDICVKPRAMQLVRFSNPAAAE